MIHDMSACYLISTFHFITLRPHRWIEKNEILDRIKDTDVCILARYMQILSKEFITHYNQPIINIHHSFLPAFKGAKPYQQAFDRGVKMIGATSHFVTEALDEGPLLNNLLRQFHIESP